MIEALEIEFGFDSSLESNKLRSMLTELQQRTDHAADNEPATVVYIGAESEYLPEEIPPSRAVDYVIEHDQGAIQFQYSEVHYLVQVNPSGEPTTVAEDGTDRIVVSIDGVYFKSDNAVVAADITEIVRTIEAQTTPDTVVGFGVDTGQGDPIPPIEWLDTGSDKHIPIHWLTFVPIGVTGISVPSEVYEKHELSNGTLYVLTDNPTSFGDIRCLQQNMVKTES